MEDDEDQSTCIEPVISYCSSFTTRGVIEISKTKYNSLKNSNKINSPLISRSSSLYNTVMLPFIISEGSINNENNAINLFESDQLVDLFNIETPTSDAAVNYYYL